MTKQMKTNEGSKAKLTTLGRKALFDAYEFSFEVTEAIIEAMEEKGIKRADLSRIMGVSRSYVTQLLEGSVNITLRKFVEVCHALDTNPRALVAKKFSSFAPRTNRFHLAQKVTVTYTPISSLSELGLSPEGGIDHLALSPIQVIEMSPALCASQPKKAELAA